jgi:hypothetical protein
MTCPHFVDGRSAHTSALCIAGAMPTEASRTEEVEYCGSAAYLRCPRYRTIASDLCLAIHREVARAIG